MEGKNQRFQFASWRAAVDEDGQYRSLSRYEEMRFDAPA
jgi:hypothetical protein